MSKKIKVEDLTKNAKLKLAFNTVTVGDNIIEVKTYLPIAQKLSLISSVLNQVLDTSKYDFVNPVHVEVITTVELISAYTDIDITEEKEEARLLDLYDTFEKYGITNTIIKAIPAEEYNFIVNSIQETIDSYYKYQNSIKGILEAVSTDYSNLDLDVTKLREKLDNVENIDLVKNVVTKLG